MSRILVTGAAGYIGSHACLEFLKAGHEVVGVDSLENGSLEAIGRVEALASRAMKMHTFDLRESDELDRLFRDSEIETVVHFAGLKAVGDSVKEPLTYYSNNVGSAISLLQAMKTAGVSRIVFSSSCTVYGNPSQDEIPLNEQSPIGAVNPYGRTKVMIEEMLSDICAADPDFRAISLRYFNPIGADASGRLGEDPLGTPNNLLPFVMQVATGHRASLEIFGDDYETRDGTCVRDYVHVVDLVLGHVKAVEALDEVDAYLSVNLGTGVGSTVKEVLAASETAVGVPIAHEFVERRAGDAGSVFADPSFARERLGWTSEADLLEMCRDHWNWHRLNPQGYRQETDVDGLSNSRQAAKGSSNGES